MQGWNVLDVGGGTGRFSSRLHDGLRLRKPVRCVDPSEALIKVARTRKGVEAVVDDALHYLSNAKGRSFDRVLLKEMIHHIPVHSLSLFCEALEQCLSKEGIGLVITRLKDVRGLYPLFHKAFDVWAKDQRTIETYTALMRKAGLSVDVEMKDYEICLPLNRWCEMVKHRFWSTFSNFTDAELAEGIKEIRKTWSDRADKDGNITFTDRLVFIKFKRVPTHSSCS